MKYSFQPYEGTDPYIFVSYSHQDHKKVVSLLEALNRAGYRVWYDVGIRPGTRWTDSVAEHIAGCAVFIPLHSHASIYSDLCRDEIHFARHEKRVIIPVYL